MKLPQKSEANCIVTAKLRQELSFLSSVAAFRFTGLT